MDWSRFLDILCQSARGLQILFVVSLVSIVVLLASLQVVEPGSGTYVVAVVQLVSFAGVFVLTAIGLYLCVRRTEARL